jgi:prepilin-type N-terminal cleavage/methylation domain-containing protein
MHRLHTHQGMTLVEVLIAMVVIAIAVSGLVAGLGGGILAIQRSAKASAAGAFADQQMEAYRGTSFASIATTPTAALDCIYKGTVSAPTCPGPGVADNAYDATWKIDNVPTSGVGACAQNYCVPSRTVAGGNGVSYRIDSYVVWACGITGATLTAAVAPATIPTCSGTPANAAVKAVTVIVRDASTNRTLVRVTSTFSTLAG